MPAERTAAMPDIVGIVGTGTMGAGIAQVALEHGHRVLLHDVEPAAVRRGAARIRDGLARRAAKAAEPDPDAWIDRLLADVQAIGSLGDLAQGADVVIEAALEELELKRAIFRELDASAAPDVILATNTSALSVTEIADAVSRPDRVVGLHFFNPVPVMRLVEVVAGHHTSPEVVGSADALVRGWGKIAVRCTDSPGFIVNRVNRPYTIEGLRMVEAGIAGVEAIDAAMRGAGFPMGPFELMDLAGIDVNLAAARGVWTGLGEPDRLRPSPIQERLVAGGRLGRKSGGGFYRYVDGRKDRVDDDFRAGVDGPEPDAIRARILEALHAEAVRARDDGVASETEIDLALRTGAGHPQGPFERSRGTEDGPA